MDVFGVAFCLGCLLAMYRRAFARKPSLGHNWRDWWLLGILLALGVTGFAVEALRMHYTQVEPWLAHWSTVGWLIDRTFLRGIDLDSAKTMHLVTWWLHTILVAGFFATIPVNRFLHVITGPLNIAARPERPMGALVPLTMEEVEQTGRTGVGELCTISTSSNSSASMPAWNAAAAKTPAPRPLPANRFRPRPWWSICAA